MLVSEMVEALGLEVLGGEKGMDAEMKGVYVCDLLSWVMSKLEKGNCWITIQTHINVVAVAMLGEAACILIPENAQVDENTIEKANEENIPLLRSSLNAYKLIKKIGELEDVQ